MGGTTSKANKGVVKQGGDVPNVPNESSTLSPSAIDMVALQVYDNIRDQLLDLQKRQIEESKKMTENIKEKLTPPKTQSLCTDEESKLLSCLKKENSSVACSIYIDNLHKCCIKNL